MRPSARGCVPLLALLLASGLAGCAAPDRQQSEAAGASQPRVSKRVVAAIMGEPPALHAAFIPGGLNIQTSDVVGKVINAGLTIVDPDNVRRPMLAQEVPTLENGLWRVADDGRMELTWRLRPGATWHDGAPFRAEDLAFSTQVAQDRDLIEFGNAMFQLVDAVEVVDSQTAVIRWKTPYFKADTLLATGILPEHLLGPEYAERKDGFRNLPYWTTEYVGLGPYRIKEWASGSHFLLQAHDGYVLGRPKIDEIEVRFVLDANVLVANLTSGIVEITIGTGLNLEQAVGVRDQWREQGRLFTPTDAWIYIAPQFINPNPAVMTDLRFRRALAHAVDRQAMADEIQYGLVNVAHSNVRPDEPEYREIERFLVRHEFDPRRAEGLLSELGYTRNAEGVQADGTGRRLSLEVRATGSPAIHVKAMQPIADYWQRVGIATDQVIIPVQRLTDLEYRYTFPAVEVNRFPTGAASVDQIHGSRTALPENRFTLSSNRSRYQNAEFDELIDRYLATIPWGPRMEVLGRIVEHISGQLNYIGVFYDVAPTLVSRRLMNVSAPNPTWNIHEWDAR